MSNDELAKYGFELCEMSGECDICEKDVEQQDYFWRSTSHEYIEGDYYCRECASKEASEFEGFLTQLAPDKGQAAVVKDNQVFAPCGLRKPLACFLAGGGNIK